MSDALRLLSLLRDYREQGVHSHDARSWGVSGNPSQRAKDLVDRGHGICTKREMRGRRQGSRYWLREYAPADAVRVKGNREDADVEVAAGGGSPGGAPGCTSRDPGAGGDVNPLIEESAGAGRGGTTSDQVVHSPAPSDADTKPIRLVADYRDRHNPTWFTEPLDPRGERKVLETPELGAAPDRHRRIPDGSELGGLEAAA